MSPDDRRHGTWAGYLVGCRLDCCRTAARQYQKARVVDAHRGRPRTVSPVGTRRRIQALGCLGWTGHDISKRLGRADGWVAQVMMSPVLWRSTADRIAQLYDEMSMSLPPTENADQRRKVSRQQGRAERLGWLPPLAWDDIDNDPEPPVADDSDEPDEAVVERLLAGAWEHPSTPAERAEAARRWHASGRSLHDLAKRTGWKVERYYKASDEEAA